MIGYFLRPVFIVVIIFYCTLAVANETITILKTKGGKYQNSKKPVSIVQAKNDGISDSVEDEGSSDLLLQKFIQDKNMMGLRGVTEFKDFKSTNVSKRLDNIESLMMALMKRSTDCEDVHAKLDRFQTTLDELLRTQALMTTTTEPTITSNITRSPRNHPTTGEYLNSSSLPKTGGSLNGKSIEQIAAEVPTKPTVAVEIGSGDLHTKQYRTPQEYLNSLSLPRTGNSFNGKTVEQIVAEIPSSLVVAIEIVNHLDMELTEYRQYLYDNYQLRKAPSTVYFQTREVFAFWRWLFHLPKGVVLYRVGDTGFSLHLLFGRNIFAVGFLENNAPIETFNFIMSNGFKKYNHTGPPDSVKSVEDFAYTSNDTRTLTIHHGTIYAILTIQSFPSEQPHLHCMLFLTMEVFKFDP